MAIPESGRIMTQNSGRIWQSWPRGSAESSAKPAAPAVASQAVSAAGSKAPPPSAAATPIPAGEARTSADVPAAAPRSGVSWLNAILMSLFSATLAVYLTLTFVRRQAAPEKPTVLAAGGSKPVPPVTQPATTRARGSGTQGAARGPTRPSGPAQSRPARGGAGNGVASRPATVPAGTLVQSSIRLPGPASEVTPAGNGRYLVIHMKKLQSLAIVDLFEKRVAKIMDLPAGDTHIAAGLDKLFVASTDLNNLVRYDLKTLKKEETVLEPEGGIQWLGIGSGSTGPLVAASAKKTLVYDPTALATDPGRWGSADGNWMAPPMRLSGDGQTLLSWGNGWAGIQASTVRDQTVVETHRGGYLQGENPRTTYDGSLIFGHENAVFNGAVASAGYELDGYPIASQSPLYFVTVRGRDPKEMELKFYLIAWKRSIYTLKGVEELAPLSLAMEDRIFFVPQAELLAIVGPAEDQITFRKINVVDGLNAAGIDYLFVTSTANPEAALGTNYVYQVESQSKPRRREIFSGRGAAHDDRFAEGKSGMVGSTEILIG